MVYIYIGIGWILSLVFLANRLLNWHKKHLELANEVKDKQIESIKKLDNEKRHALLAYKHLDFKYAAVSNRLEELKRHKVELIQELDRVKKKIKKR